MNHYGLDPAWYFSAPDLAWDASLKIIKVQLELLSDPDMLLMIESRIRGGIAIISFALFMKYAFIMSQFPQLPTTDSAI